VFLVGFLLPIIPLLPIRLALLIPVVASTVQPTVVAVTAGVGAALGTIPLYAITLRVEEDRRVLAWLQHEWMKKLLTFLEGKMFLAILLFALLPLPDQLMSVLGGFKRYPASRMILGFFLGRMPYFLALAYIGSANRQTIQGAWHAVIRTFGI
jgi:membrane protein YqaA with SNARE-associated domain